MAFEFSNECNVVRGSNSAAAGVTAVTTSAIDMSLFGGVCFVAQFNTVVDGSVLTLTAYEVATNVNSGGTAITNAATPAVTAATSSNLVMMLDVIRPSKRYVYCTLTRTAQNATLDSILAIQYRASNAPVTQPAGVIGSALGGFEQ